MRLLVDSTGVKFLGEGEWKRKKHGPEYRREWRKVHLSIDVQTLEIRAVEVTSNAIGAAPMLPELLAQIPSEEAIASVCADGAYDTRGCLDAIAQRGATAVIPPRKNASLWHRPSPGAESRNEAVRACRRLGRQIWKTWSGYHRRSLVETKMHCFKRLGERVTARTFERQVVEVHVRVALLNRFNESVWGWGHSETVSYTKPSDLNISLYLATCKHPEAVESSQLTQRTPELGHYWL